MKLKFKIMLPVVLLSAGLLAGCGNSQQSSQSDNANNRTNDTSEYVQQHINTDNGGLKNYINGATYDKIHNTVVIRVHKQQNFQNVNFQHALKQHINYLRTHAHNPHVHTKLVRTNNSNADND